MSTFTPTVRTQVKRLPKRGAYDRETVFNILDEAFVCHVGFVVEGQPYVIPTNYGRVVASGEYTADKFEREMQPEFSE